MADRLAAALAWAARGFRVFPCAPGTKKPPHGFEDFPSRASNDPTTVAGWWIDQPDSNIGVVGDGLCIVDLDTKRGPNGVASWLDQGGAFDTLCVRTPSGGYHLYYAAPPTANTQGDRGGLAPGIDTRGPRGYVLAPGSEFEGKPYTLEQDAPVRPLPAPILARLHAPRERAEAVAAVVELDSPSAIAVAKAFAQSAAPAIEGLGGDNHTYQTATEMRDRGVSEHQAFWLLLEHWNPRCEPPWAEDELWAKVQNAYAYAQNQPGAKHPEAHFNGAIIEPPVMLPAVNEPAVTEFGNLADLLTLKPRPWLLHRVLLRGETTAIFAPGGAGKSQLMLTVAIFLALGVEKIFGFYNRMVGHPCRSMIYNAEDNLDEMFMRVHATCTAYGIDPALVKPHIRFATGKGQGNRLTVTSGNRWETIAHEANINYLVQFAHEHQVGFMAFDPLFKLHTAEENDNTAMGLVLDAFDQIAHDSGAALMLAHHSPKGKGSPGDPAMGRGAGAIRDSVRIALTLEPPTDDDVARLNMHPQDRNRYLRLDDAKMNRSLLGREPVWLQKQTIKLHTGEEVGAFVPGEPVKQANAIRQQIVDTLAVEVHALNTTHVSITQAVQLLRNADPIWSQVDSSVVRQRIENIITGICESSSGHSVRILVEGQKRMVVVD